MSDLSPLLCFGSVGLAIFVLGLLIGLALGFTIIRSYRSRLLLNQNQGEGAVRKLILSNFKAPNFHLLNNVTIPFQDGTTQIDQILVSTKGVFVIEVKHYSGWIFGMKNQINGRNLSIASKTHSKSNSPKLSAYQSNSANTRLSTQRTYTFDCCF